MVIVNYAKNRGYSTIITEIDDKISHAGVGSDNTTPLVSDTELGGETYRESILSSQSLATAHKVTLYLDQTENNGNSQREIGTFNASSGGTMYTRNLVTLFDKTSDKSSRYVSTLQFEIVQEDE